MGQIASAWCVPTAAERHAATLPVHHAVAVVAEGREQLQGASVDACSMHALFSPCGHLCLLPVQRVSWPSTCAVWVLTD